jgi:xylulokinase
MSTVLGIDVGSNSARAVALDRDGKVVAAGAGRYQGAEGWPAGRAEPGAWLAAVVEAVKSLGLRPAAISVGGQSPTTVPVDGSPAVTVRHPAGATGSPEEQHYAQRQVTGTEKVMQVYDWVMARLGAADRQSRWPGDPTLDGYGRRAESGTVIGHTDGAHGLPRDIPLVAGAQDAYLAFWAGGVDIPGRGLDPGGRTGGLAVAISAAGADTGLFSLRSPATGVDIVGGPVSGHGLMLEWLGRLTGRTVPELLELAATVPAGAEGVTVLPYLEGERAPRWRRELRAEVSGLSSEHGPAHLARAALEGAAYGLRHIADSLPGPFDVLVCAGSPARSPLWCQIKADVLEVPVEVPEVPDLAAYGAALSAGAGAGWWPAPGTAAGGSWPRPAVTVVRPAPQRSYREAYRRFVELGDTAEHRLTSK